MAAAPVPVSGWRPTARAIWITWFGPAVLAIWFLIGVFLMFRRYEAFWTTTYDQALYSQVIWNTAHGRWFASSLYPRGHLADHFSPALAVLAPFVGLFPDGRVLLLVKVLAIGVAALPAYVIVHRRYPALAPFLILAFVFNPAVNAAVMDSGDFHGLHLAPLALVLALFGWLRERRLLLAVALALALLVREDMGVYVASFGLFLLLFQPRWRRWGAGIIGAAAIWTVLVIKVLIPAAGQSAYTYLPEASKFSAVWGAVLAGRIPAVSDVVQLFLAPDQVGMIWSLLAPMGLLPLLGTGAQLLWVPGVMYQATVATVAGGLRGHFLAPLFPLWWASAAMALVSMPARWVRGGVAFLLGATLLGGWQLGLHGPANPTEWPRLTALTEHNRLGPAVLRHVPPDADVVAQNGLGPHLAFRPKFHMFPWYKHHLRPQLIVLDAKSDNIYPYLTTEDLVEDIRHLQLDPTVRLAYEQDDYYILGLDEDPHYPHQGTWQWLPYLQLEGYGLAETDSTRAFQPAPFRPAGGRKMRVELFWTALARMTADYKISVRLTAPDGYILAQDDAWPGQGNLRTTDWEAGRTIRDLHYLDLPEGELPSPLNVAVVVYDGDTLIRLPPENDVVLATLP